KPAIASEVADRSLALDSRPGRQLDGHRDGAIPREGGEMPPPLGRLDQQGVLAELDGRLLRSLHVGLFRFVAWSDDDDGVAAIARDDPEIAHAHGDRHVYRLGCLEAWHGGHLTHPV